MWRLFVVGLHWVETVQCITDHVAQEAATPSMTAVERLEQCTGINHAPSAFPWTRMRCVARVPETL